MANIIAIVGRPNVGKSTLFNRLIGRREAIMDNVSGVTRDRHYGHSDWIGKYFAVIDTGGYVTGSDDIYEAEIREQVEIAMGEATVILFLVDAEEGIHPLDEEFAKILRRSKKPIILVANKSDNTSRYHHSAEFYNLGMGEVWPISSQSGSGTGELLDELVKHFPEEGVEDPDAGIPRISILGRPNVGKSSFLNTILGYKRSIVTDQAGTTRDAINARYKAYGNDFIIVDTAGLRRRTKVTEDIEFYSTLRSVQALEDSDVCIIMIDATRGMEAQDLHLIGMAEKARKGIVILVNKWDLIENKDGNTAANIETTMRERIANMSYIPIMFISVLTKQRIFQAIEKAIQVYNNKNNKVSTSQLNEVMLAEIESYPPPAIKGKYIKIKYITQLPSRTPSFAFFCNLPQYIQPAYERYLENRLREHFDFEGVPVNLFFRQK